MNSKPKAKIWLSIISYDTNYLLKRINNLFKSNIFADC